jgi:hypothetical protein
MSRKYGKLTARLRSLSPSSTVAGVGWTRHPFEDEDAATAFGLMFILANGFWDFV